ncbi:MULTISPECIES: flagellar biosynthesis protein FliQ [Rhodopirellula]|uniref:Flagellar biosynthetic protein FliQ n=1 Tax=Rhodopirellula sallentina SM41 TaxID=1263870 RepID=M5TRW7_9BACT|nr:flagellar biosynthesis protein FliQ [Rhodopirellula sallentina]EMI51789.1 Bacterial export protein FliQ, family 3 [Rhodopirellula sallentina SM41]
MLEPSSAVDLIREALIVAIVLATPMLLIGMAAGLAIGLIQALTQIQDQTVSFVPKILAMAAVLVVCMPWLMTRMIEFTRSVFENAGGL